MTIAVDFDGTIVSHAYPAIGKPVPFAIEALKKLQNEDHHQLILWTCREGKLLEDAVEYCKSKGLEFYAVNTNYPDEVPDEFSARKLMADLFIDDHNLGGLPDWGIIYQMIHAGKCFKPIPNVDADDDMIPERKPRKKSLLQKLFG